MNNFTRRSLLTGGVLIALPVIGLGGMKLWCISNSLPRAQASNIESLSELYRGSAAAKQLGEKYLRQTGSTAAAALRRLQRDKLIACAAGSGCFTKAMLAVGQACRGDFRAKRVYSIDGWILAQTELDVAALCTMT
jgi:hypothetical protein